MSILKKIFSEKIDSKIFLPEYLRVKSAKNEFYTPKNPYVKGLALCRTL